MHEVCSKLTITKPDRRHRSGAFIVNFEQISHYCSDVFIVDFEQVNAGWVHYSNEYHVTHGFSCFRFPCLILS